MELLTTGDTAALLQVSTQTVRRLVIKGILPAERFPEDGAHRRIRRDDLEAFAEKNNLTLDWSRLPA